MNLSDTWTSRGSRMGTSWTPTSPTPWTQTSSQVSLRLVRKTSGLFNTERAGNTFVASQAMKPGTEPGAMEAFVSMATDEGSLGGIFQDLPMDLKEADYLDSFMDLSNFLIPEDSGKVTDDVNVDSEEMKEKVLDFSGIMTSLDTVSPAVTVDEIVPASTTSPRKRKLAETLDDISGTTVNVSYLDVVKTEIQVDDHDYVSKKMKMDAGPKAGTSMVQKELQSENRSRSKNKYRERRDKNNAASKRSREIRKMKYIEMAKEADTLEIKNEALRKKIVELENLAKVMKAELIKKMTQK